MKVTTPDGTIDFSAICNELNNETTFLYLDCSEHETSIRYIKGKGNRRFTLDAVRHNALIEDIERWIQAFESGKLIQET